MSNKIAHYQEILNQLNPDGKIRAYHVAAALEKKHTSKQKQDMFFEQVKTGSSYVGKPRILDAVAIRPSWTTPCITGYEIKVDRGDFLRDDKWREYLPYTNEFYFAAPKGIIQESELPDEIGLVIFNPKTKSVRTSRKAAWREIEKATAFDLLYFVVMWRTEKHHGYTNVERIEQYLNGKIGGRELSHHFSNKLINQLREAERKVEDIDYKIRRLETYEENLNQIREMLVSAGITCGYYNIVENIKKLIDGRGNSLDDGMKQEIFKIVAAANQLETVLNYKRCLK